MLLAVPHDGNLQLFGQRVNHRETNTMETPRDLVAAAAEFPAGMQLGHHDLEGGLTLLSHHVDRNAAPVVGHRSRPVIVEGYLDPGAKTGERLINGVVNNLVNEVMKAPVIG